jgi:small ligand-binding sensory domain FIST
MIRVGFGLSTVLSPQAAAREAAELAITRLGCGRPDLALVVASAAHGQGLPTIVREAERLLGRGAVVGGSVEGIVSANVEVSSFPAVMVLALSGVEAVPFMVSDAEGEELRVGEDIAARAGDLESSDLVVLLADSSSLEARALAQGLAAQLGPATVLGTGAGPTPRGRPLLWHDGELAHDAVAGFVLHGTRSRVAIAQAGRAVTPPLTITGARGNWVLGLDGRPALDVYTEVANRLGLDAGGEAPAQLLAGLAGCDDQTTDLLVRNVVGFDPDRRRFSIPEPVVVGQRLALVVLDAGAARSEFASQLEELDAGSSAFGLYFNCRARGASLFGEPGVEAKHIANAFADLPVAGLVGPYQLAPTPLRREPAVLTYAGALALVEESE